MKLNWQPTPQACTEIQKAQDALVAVDSKSNLESPVKAIAHSKQVLAAQTATLNAASQSLSSVLRATAPLLTTDINEGAFATSATPLENHNLPGLDG